MTESRRPAAIRESPRAAWYVVAAVCVGAFMGQLDASIVTTALPSLDAGFHATVGAVEWVSLVYLLVLVATVAPVGHLADAAGRKLLYVYGFAVFTVASVLCGLAPTLWLLICFRAVQALGAAMLQANSVALIAEAMPGRSLARGIGVQGTAQALGLAFGPAVGGALIALGGWRLIFFVNAPVGLVGIVLGWFLLPRSRFLRPRGEGMDVRGAALLAAAATAALTFLSLEQRAGSRLAVGALLAAAAVVATVLFVRNERRHPLPLIDLQLLRRRRLSVGLASGFVCFLALFGVLLVVPYYLTSTGTGSLETGLVLAVLPAAIAITAPLAGRRAARHAVAPFTAAGLLVLGVGLAGMAVRHTTLALIPALAIAGVGVGIFTPANNAGVMSAAPPGRRGVVSGVLNMTRGLGTAFGVAVASLLYTGHGITVALGALAGLAVLTSAFVLAAGDDAEAREA